MSTNSEICWICGVGAAETAEHKIKRSDLRGALRAPSQSNPLYRHDAETKNVAIPGLNSKLLKFPKSLCASCNGARTQPHDRAWEKMSEHVRAAMRDDTLGTRLDANQIFGTGYVANMLDVHLFFVKQLGCYIRHEEIAIELAPFSDAIMTGTACPFVHLKFGLSPDSVQTAAVTSIEIDWRTSDGSCAAAAYIYSVGGLEVMVMFTAAGEEIDGLMNSWHPSLGTERLIPLNVLA